MAAIDEVLERFVNEPAFRDAVAADPESALDGYELSADDLELLASQFSRDAGGRGGVERRLTKAGLSGLLSQAAEDGAGLADFDGDGLSDENELLLYGTDPADADSDDDLLSDGEEVQIWGTDPNLADTDGDGLADGPEIQNFYPSDPLDPNEDGSFGGSVTDTDGDGFSDWAEEKIYGTDPNLADTDGDGAQDLVEIVRGTDPHDTDSDDDGLNDHQELQGNSESDPLNPDSDGDGYGDGHEVKYGTSPGDAADFPDALKDSDGDGLTNVDEVDQHGTDPHDADSDNDKLSDADEVLVHGTDPNAGDTDGDGVHDEYELTHELDPLNEDTDGDGFVDGAEFHFGTDPHDAGESPAPGPANPFPFLADGEQPGGGDAISPDDVGHATELPEKVSDAPDAHGPDLLHPGEATDPAGAAGLAPPPPLVDVVDPADMGIESVTAEPQLDAIEPEDAIAPAPPLDDSGLDEASAVGYGPNIDDAGLDEASAVADNPRDGV
ncbi:MAG: hypothetical protein HYU28_04715 [Actinobacteria bacterium]|nr:hypothetical protein [Actinomycetota bacterium]